MSDVLLPRPIHSDDPIQRAIEMTEEALSKVKNDPATSSRLLVSLEKFHTLARQRAVSQNKSLTMEQRFKALQEDREFFNYVLDQLVRWTEQKVENYV